MGYVEIVNPLENLVIEVPYIALHYLEHGSFMYDGDVHSLSYLNARKLNAVLEADGTWHRLALEPDDRDKDGLADVDESYLGTDSTKVDTDFNGVVDGTQLSRAFAAVIDVLPREAQSDSVYVEEHQVWGSETCARCGELVNMGFARVINPRENQWIDLPYIALHYMKCGGFGFDGTVHDGRVDPIKLATLLGVNPTSVQSKPGNTPAEFALWPCFPNPFNASTVIRYDLPSASFVRLEIYNALGQKIKTLVHARESAGEHRIQWDASNDAGQPTPSGVYLIQLQAGKETRTHKVTVVR
jgi:hypothetical protein